MSTILHKTELKPFPPEEFHYLQVLPYDWFLIDPTENEKKIVSLYARWVLRLEEEIRNLKGEEPNVTTTQ